MKYLLIDTTNNFATVSIIENHKIIYEFHDKITTDMASKILPIISNAFEEVGFKINDVDKIFIINGPGSFTGIRIGVTIAKTMAWALNKAVIPISSLELIATTHSNKKYIVPMIDARRSNVFAGIYKNDLSPVMADKLMSLAELSDMINNECELISYDDIDLRNVIKPNIDIIKIIQKHELDVGVNPHKLNPIYLKKTEAEEKAELNND